MAGIPCKAALDRGVICDDQGIMKVSWIENSYLDILKLWPSAPISAFTSGVDLDQPFSVSPKVCFLFVKMWFAVLSLMSIFLELLIKQQPII